MSMTVRAVATIFTFALVSLTSLEGQEPAVESTRWPPVRISLPEVFVPLGSATIALYGVATAEIHVFGDVEGGVVQRLYWIQFEEFNEGSDRRYDYSREPWRVEVGGRSFFGGPNRYPRTDLTEADEGSDSGAVVALVRAAGLELPQEIARVRLVHLDDTRQKELMIIYLEDVRSLGTSLDDIESGQADWVKIAEGVRDRAVSGLALR